jgi:predicted SprT family Zn-dependent metalloprotease
MNIKQAREMANDLIHLHRLSPEWSFTFDRSNVRFGKCNYRKREISLSKYLAELNEEMEVRDTILHEIAHALAPRGAGHGAVWKSLALSIGCNGRRCFGPEVVRPTPKYRGTCPSCGQTIVRYRRAVIACGKCTPVFDPKFLFVWSIGTAKVSR